MRLIFLFPFSQNAQQIHGPFLVVVPLSTLSNWAKEFRKWLPDMNVIVYVGTRASREVSQVFCTADKGRYFHSFKVFIYETQKCTKKAKKYTEVRGAEIE